MSGAASNHPERFAVGNKVQVVRRHGHSVAVRHEATVVRHTATLVILDSGEKFKSGPWSWDEYVMTPPYLDYRTTLEDVTR